jgi:hypothetical protein
MFAAALMAAPMLAGAQESGIAIGSDAPGAVVETLDGKPLDLAEYVKKGLTLLQFGPWCLELQGAGAEDHRGDHKYAGKVKFVAVAVSVNQSVDRIKAYATSTMQHDIVYDWKGYASDVYEVAATSYIVVVDGKEGRLHWAAPIRTSTPSGP